MDKNTKIIGLFLETVNAFSELEKKPRTYGSDVELFNSEVDTLCVIGQEGSINLTQLAGQMEISKSGTSKFIRRLMEKELIEKHKKQNNKKEVIFTLTPKGKRVYKERLAFNKQLFNELYQTVSRYVDMDKEIVENFLYETIEGLKRLESLEHGDESIR